MNTRGKLEINFIKVIMTPKMQKAVEELAKKKREYPNDTIRRAIQEYIDKENKGAK